MNHSESKCTMNFELTAHPPKLDTGVYSSDRADIRLSPTTGGCASLHGNY